MDKKFHLNIVTPEKEVFDGPVTSIIAPGSEGYLGVLSNHAPLMTGLVRGKLIIDSPSKGRFEMKLESGFMEVLNNVVTILADGVETEVLTDVSKI